MNNGHVFISYSRKDKAAFEQVKASLRHAGLKIWTDERIEPGSVSWQENIEKAIEEAGCVVVLLSPDAKASIWVRKELYYAQVHHLPIFGLLVRGDETTSVPFTISGSQHVDIRDNYQAGIGKLLPMLKQTGTAVDDPEPVTETAALTHPGGHGSPPVIRVVIADDHNVVRKGLRMLLSDTADIEVIAEATDGEQAVSVCMETRPDVILMDMQMPHKDGIEATRLIRATCPDTKVIVVTSFTEESAIQAILQAGAIGFLMKDVSEVELSSAIRRAHEGQYTLAPEAAEMLIRMKIQPPAPAHDLTEREMEVLALMIDGLSNQAIGTRLSISPSTVRNHVTSIQLKLGTNSRTQAIVQAVEFHVVR